MSLYDPAALAAVKSRISALNPDSPRVWGKMDVAQMLAHCAIVMEHAVGERRPPRLLMGRLFGPMVKRRLMRPDGTMGRNAPTAPDMRVVDERDLAREREHLVALIDRFAAAGPAGCTTHPHTFFGPMAPEEWATLMYKHLDHHLKQFSV